MKNDLSLLVKDVGDGTNRSVIAHWNGNNLVQPLGLMSAAKQYQLLKDWCDGLWLGLLLGGLLFGVVAVAGSWLTVMSVLLVVCLVILPTAKNLFVYRRQWRQFDQAFQLLLADLEALGALLKEPWPVLLPTRSWERLKADTIAEIEKRATALKLASLRPWDSQICDRIDDFYEAFKVAVAFEFVAKGEEDNFFPDLERLETSGESERVEESVH